MRPKDDVERMGIESSTRYVALKTRLTEGGQTRSFSNRKHDCPAVAHPDLVKVVERAIALRPSGTSNGPPGLRTGGGTETSLSRQGASASMNSRHLTGHALDLAPAGGRGSAVGSL